VFRRVTEPHAVPTAWLRAALVELMGLEVAAIEDALLDFPTD
jgi:hypothetical protein